MTEMPPPFPLTLIVAATLSNGIGINSSLPWRLTKEMAYFAKVTKGAEGSEGKGKNVVVMGRKTWEGIPDKFRPLSGRINIVVSRDEKYNLKDAPSTHLLTSLSSLPTLLSSLSLPPTSTFSPQTSKTFLIGGSQLYSHSLSPSSSSSPTRVLLTRIISPDYKECDVFFPELKVEDGWKKASHEELEEFVGFEVERGEIREVDKLGRKEEVRYRFEMWVR